MQLLNELEIGVMFWAGRGPAETLREVMGLGARCGQIGIPGGMPLHGAAAQWKAALDEAGFTVFTVFAAFEGEDYADIPAVERTVGFVPHATRETRVERILALSDFASELGVASIGAHVGFVPNHSDPEYAGVRELVRRICDHAAQRGQTFALETGQEPAAALLGFLKDVDRSNAVINFDPANMILYGTGDPIEALGLLGPDVRSVHAKDGDWPPEDKPGALGTERPLGQGSVGIERFVRKLRRVGYTGPLAVEREGTDHARWLEDVAAAVKLLNALVAATAP